MVDMLRRTFIVGDLVTIAPEFRYGVVDFEFEKYIGIVVESYDVNEYIVYWTNAPTVNCHRGIWNGDHLVKIEDYESAKKDRKSLHAMNI